MENDSQLPPPSPSSEPPPVPAPSVTPPPPSPPEVPDIPSPPPVPEPAAAPASSTEPPPPASAVPPAVSAAFAEVGKDLQGMATEKNLAMFCHLSAIVGGVVLAGAGIGIFLPIGNILGPLFIWLWKKDTMSKVNDHGKEALNFQITVSIILGMCALTWILILPILVAIATGIAALILTIIATIKASNGEFYRYPFSLRLIK